MSFGGLEFRRLQPLREPAICSFCRNPIDANALFCDVCGRETLHSLEVKRASLEAQIRELEASIEKAKVSRIEVDALNAKIKSLTETLQPITMEVETLKNKKDQLTNETEALTDRIAQLGKLRQSEESTIDYLRKQRVQLEQEVKHGTAKIATRRPQTRQQTGRQRELKHIAHTFVCKYEGTADWNAELAKLVAQFALSVDSTNYSASPQKIVFTVTGAPTNIEKFAAALNGLNGFVNLRSRLAATKKHLREVIDERNTHSQQLDAMNNKTFKKMVKKCPSCGYNNRDDATFCSSCGVSLAGVTATALKAVPWYRGNKGTLSNEKTELTQRIAEDEAKIKTINEELKTLEELLA